MNNIKKFFDDKASGWDAKEVKTSEFFSKFVKDNLGLQKGMQVLDLGCGTGVITNFIHEITQTKVIGMDISSNMIDIAKNKIKNPEIQFVCEDFYNTKLNNFDAIVVHNAYPHFMDKIGFKNQCIKSLKSHGYLIICHSISRDQVNACHSKINLNISNGLLSPEEESKLFLDKFRVIKLRDDDIYLMILQKI